MTYTKLSDSDSNAVIHNGFREDMPLILGKIWIDWDGDENTVLGMSDRQQRKETVVLSPGRDLSSCLPTPKLVPQFLSRLPEMNSSKRQT